MAQDLKTYLSNRRTRLPRPIPVEEAAQQIEQLHTEHGGATFSLYFGDVAGQELYAVSVYPERSIKVRGPIVSARRLQVFIAQNQDLLTDPRCAIGVWYKADENATYLDVTATLPDEIAAVALGRQYNQIAVFDLLRREEINTGGNGEPLLNLVPETRRLPPLAR